MCIKYGISSKQIADERIQILKIKQVLESVYAAVVKEMKREIRNTNGISYNVKKPKDLLELICDAHHQHDLCEITYKLMQEERVTCDFRQGNTMPYALSDH